MKLITKNRLKNKIINTKIKNAKKICKKTPTLENLQNLQSLFSKYRSTISKNKAARTISRLRLYINVAQ